MKGRFIRQWSEPQVNSARRIGFTLVELLVVIAMAAVWVSLLAPTLARTRPSSQSIQCLNNLRQLGVAWKMYAEDYQGRLVYNVDGLNAGKTPDMRNWVAGWLDYLPSNPDNTNINLLISPEASQGNGGFLGPYLNRSARPFKCPADKSTVVIAGQRAPRVRSVSMNSWVGEGARKWNGNSPCQLYRKTSDIVKPTPANLWILLDEREDSINDGKFFVDADTSTIVDYPGSYHNGAGSFVFADGHSELHKWRDRRTMPPLVPGQFLPLNIPSPGNPDVAWLQAHATSRP